MKNRLTSEGRKFALKQIVLMAITVLLITLFVYYFWGYHYAKSALIGGFVGIIPNMIFAYKAFKYAGAQSSRKVMESFYSGVKLKMLYTALLFALVFKFLIVAPVALLGTYSVITFLPLLLPVFITVR
ncbi:ATP synthase subunit I [Colwellia sp. E2M01]|uniref:ATP synthase subunit I n=1 Tax=Colwellia sp. E2M01 TaxID=2841561 RepID=UPI001C090056|nr:ATP synthase subunit I [Colwellia sp. E2M01]MBU2871737.1 ATP synthase subunit I [Colwellia sp. E2M01]